MRLENRFGTSAGNRKQFALPAARPDHPLTRWKGRIPLKALEGERFVLRQRGTGTGFAAIGITIAPALLQAIHIEDIVWRELDLGQEAVCSIRLVTNTRQSTNTGLCRASSPPVLRTSPI
jgi:hypothetical protein